MDVWERFIHSDQPDSLVQLAIIHAEFESVHPFLDGNGRIGRLIVPLFMVAKGILQAPHFYVSGFLDQHRDEYYDRLLAVSRDDDWTGWSEFFLTAIAEQANVNLAIAKSILALYDELKDWMVDNTRSQYGIRALDWIFGKPIFLSSDFVANSGDSCADGISDAQDSAGKQFVVCTDRSPWETAGAPSFSQAPSGGGR